MKKSLKAVKKSFAKILKRSHYAKIYKTCKKCLRQSLFFKHNKHVLINHIWFYIHFGLTKLSLRHKLSFENRAFKKIRSSQLAIMSQNKIYSTTSQIRFKNLAEKFVKTFFVCVILIIFVNKCFLHKTAKIIFTDFLDVPQITF